METPKKLPPLALIARSRTEVLAQHLKNVPADVCRWCIDIPLNPVKVDILNIFSQALEFPSYFGSNLDALAECLSEMDWHEQRCPSGHLLTITSYENMGALPEGEQVAFMSILFYAASEWSRAHDDSYPRVCVICADEDLSKIKVIADQAPEKTDYWMIHGEASRATDS